MMIKRESYPSFCQIGGHKSLYVARKGYELKEEDGTIRKYVGSVCSECDADYAEAGGEGMLEVRLRYLLDEQARINSINPVLDKTTRIIPAGDGY